MSDLSPIRWAVRPLKRYADFGGRSPRSEYWWFMLLQVIAITAVALLAVALFAGGESNPDGMGVGSALVLLGIVLGFLALLLPNLAVQVRRLHDQNLSGWFILLFFIPYVGGLIGFVFMCIRGTEGPNRFGQDPFEQRSLQKVFA